MAGPGTVGWPALGTAGAHRAGALVAVLPATGTPAQEDHRLGQADDHAAAPLAAPSSPGAGGRQRLRRAGFTPLLPVPPRTSHPRRPLAPGRRPLCASATPSARTKWSTTVERPPATLAEGPLGPALSNLDRRRSVLVPRRHPHRGTHVANGGLVPLGQAACAPALGLGSGPTGRIHSPGLARHRSGSGPDPDPGMVGAALATGGHPVSSTGQALSGGAGSPGRGDPAFSHPA